MVARTPSKQPRKKLSAIAPNLSPTLLRETVKKVDKCMARLQELQYTVTGGAKAISSPPTSCYRTSVPAFKQDSFRIRNSKCRSSPPGKLPLATTEDWRRMSLPAMLLGETMGELVQATQFARNIVKAAAASRIRLNTARKPSGDPRTPPLKRKPMHNMNLEDTWHTMHARRKREKQTVRGQRQEKTSPRAKSRMKFKVSSSSCSPYKECDKENCRYVITADRVSPRNKPWARKTVLFPNPLFHSSTREKVPTTTRSNRHSPHKFLIKSPPLKPKIMIISPLKGRKFDEKVVMKEVERGRQMAHKFLIGGKMKIPAASLSANSPRQAPVPGLGKKFSPPQPAKAASARRSFSPSRLASRIVLSPMKFRSSLQKSGGGSVKHLK